ncbi:hypothetical protein BDN72DRAFT_892887 [Pluteus cervinus]|uniref:Uncharacterized protein n=1 Tax=Pluteus cervinus TaxID=181527 RepID=A0ACD3B9M9_9AGAR|nr:hypothetical protein BDN72DRAFT_892887 [Pluteus cervinus]
MSTTSDAPKRHFVVWAPDSEGALALRFQVREQHLRAIAPLIQEGTVQVGGMTVTPESIDVQPADRKALGSLLIVKAKTLEDVKQLVESDIYYTSGVWDKTKLQILPFFAATSFPN